MTTTPSGAYAGALALVSWGHSDRIVRLKRRRDARPDLLLQVPALDQITKVTTSCISSGCPSPIFMGHVSGRVLCTLLRHDAHAAAHAHAHMPLHAHDAPITDIHVSVRAGLLATASADGKIVLWDLNNLSYIRTLPNRESLPVSLVTISATLCDVASVHDPPATGRTRVAMETNAMDNDSDSYEKDETYKYESLIRVHTVNARFVGSVKIADRVTSICYSAAPEGISVNVIACGLHTGAVRLHSSWDLRHVAYIPPADKPQPLLSLTYSSDSSLLFGCYADGLVVAWEGGAPARPPPARILPAHALF
ncbi:hypothetical protein O0L34_g2169 [Tuta absoluta]|nr:hypothetical protein O0L34_g2169 [Tuta absoluta]